jgi:hypothetical protein
MHFSHDLPTVNLHCHLAQAEFRCDPLGGPPDDDERHDLTFALAEIGSTGRRGSEQSQSAGRRYCVSARLHGEFDEDAFDVGLHGLGGNLQLLSDAFVG